MAEQNDAPDVADFLAELSALTINRRIEIGGCGCCGSPYLIRINDDKKIPAGARYVVDEDESELKFKLEVAE